MVVCACKQALFHGLYRHHSKMGAEQEKEGPEEPRAPTSPHKPNTGYETATVLERGPREVGAEAPRKPPTPWTPRVRKHQQPSAGGQDNAAPREPQTQSRSVPTSQADHPHPLPGQRSPTSSPSAALRAPLPSLAFCLRNSTCLHLPSPLTPQLRETTRPCLGPPSCAAAWRPSRWSAEAIVGSPHSSPLIQG